MTIPEWFMNLVLVAAGGLGALGLGLVRATTDNRRTRSEDRTQFTDQVMRRLQDVETQLSTERLHNDERIRELHALYEKRLEIRDRTIAELRERQTSLEQMLEARA